MTPKQQRFVEEYPKDRNATKAAERSGYSPKTAGQIGHALLKKIEIKEAVTKAVRAISERTGVSIDWVVDGLRENKERAMQAVPVLDSKGIPTGEYVYQGAVANKALELLGKHVGMWKDEDGPRLPPGSHGVTFWRVGDREIPF